MRSRPGWIDAYLSGEEELSGREVYDRLEPETALIELRSIYRQGARNRLPDGSQQSYADHNRLLMEGLDRLLSADLEWYRTRLESPDAVPDERLTACFDAVRNTGFERPALLALWVAAALHDCGMLVGSDSGVDVEDGVALAAEIIDVACPPDVRALALFAVRHHDYIKDVFTGEVPATLVADDLQRLPSEQQAAAMVALGMIQVAGAASLGQGRLSAFRMMIFDRCLDGTALTDASMATRLARLGVQADDVPGLVARTPLHGWERVCDGIGSQQRLDLLRQLDAIEADHLVLLSAAATPVRRRRLRNGTTAAIVGEG